MIVYLEYLGDVNVVSILSTVLNALHSSVIPLILAYVQRDRHANTYKADVADFKRRTPGHETLQLVELLAEPMISAFGG